MKRERNTTTRNNDFSEETINRVWQKARIVPGKDPKITRKDSYDVWIRKEDYGEHDSIYGWEVDHIIPVAEGGTDQIENLQPLHHQNNRHKDLWDSAVNTVPNLQV